MAPAEGVNTAAAPTRPGHYRWVICSLLFFATGLNYVDRQTISFLKPGLMTEYGWTEQDYAFVVQGFMWAYAFGYVLFGKVIDKIGSKKGYALAVIIWTFAHLSCSILGFFPQSWLLVSFMITQFMLGLGQSGNFPAALKAVAEWFPQRERSFANGVFNAGSNVGAIVTPLLVPFVLAVVAAAGGTFLGVTGWQWAFVVTGLLSVFWLIAWLTIYKRPEEHPKLSKAELDYIESDKAPKVKDLPWSKVIFVKETWAFSLGKLLTDPVWFFYLFWLPGFLLKTYPDKVHSIADVAGPVIVIYVISDVGSIVGGWMSSAMIKAGMTVNLSRKLTMLICALCVVPVGFGVMFHLGMWAITCIVGVAAAAHQAFSANLYTLPSDTFPKAAVGTVSGIGGTAGAVGGIFMTLGVAAALKDSLSGYSVIFFVAAGVYLAALLVIHILTPKLAPAKLKL